MTTVERAPAGWPFFAPSNPDTIADALTLADIRAADHVVDLGCGDGQVLLAAAKRGARVSGVECDLDLAQSAEDALVSAGHGSTARVVRGDLFDPAVWETLQCDEPRVVYFSYLSPAMLQHLLPLLSAHSGARAGVRLVTVDFEVPGLVPAGQRGGAYLYTWPLNVRRRRLARLGWVDSGYSMYVMPPEIGSLSSLEASHVGGPVHLRVTGRLARHVDAIAGASEADKGRPVAVDLNWREREAGTLALGEVHVEGLTPHQVVILFAEDDNGEWQLTEEGWAGVSRRARSRSSRPTTTADLLDAAENG